MTLMPWRTADSGRGMESLAVLFSKKSQLAFIANDSVELQSTQLEDRLGYRTNLFLHVVFIVDRL